MFSSGEEGLKVCVCVCLCQRFENEAKILLLQDLCLVFNPVCKKLRFYAINL